MMEPGLWQLPEGNMSSLWQTLVILNSDDDFLVGWALTELLRSCRQMKARQQRGMRRRRRRRKGRGGAGGRRGGSGDKNKLCRNSFCDGFLFFSSKSAKKGHPVFEGMSCQKSQCHGSFFFCFFIVSGLAQSPVCVGLGWLSRFSRGKQEARRNQIKSACTRQHFSVSSPDPFAPPSPLMTDVLHWKTSTHTHTDPPQSWPLPSCCISLLSLSFPFLLLSPSSRRHRRHLRGHLVRHRRVSLPPQPGHLHPRGLALRRRARLPRRLGRGWRRL